MLAPFTPPPTTTTSAVWLIASPACWACYPSSASSERHRILRFVGRGGGDGLQSSIIQAFAFPVWMMLPELPTRGSVGRMKRAASVTTTHRRTIDELDTDLLATLEERDKRLYAILSKTTRYRNILMGEIKRLRAGSAPEVVRALIGQWDYLRRDIKRLAQDL